MKRRLTKLTAAGLAVLALTGCTGGAQEEVSEEPPVPKNVETTWTLVVGQPEGSTWLGRGGIFCRGTVRRHGRRRGGGGPAETPR